MKKRETMNRSRRRRLTEEQDEKKGQRQSWRWLLLTALVAFIGYGIWAYVQLPDQASDAAYGLPMQGTQPLQIKEAVSMAQASPEPTVTVQGKVVDMGPTMGCWLLVQDATGEVLVQTDPMVYMPQSLPGETMKATGRLIYGRFPLMGESGNYEGWLLLAPGVELVAQS